MKWGVRKDRYQSQYDSDQVIKKGTTIQNISADKPRSIDGSMIYGAHTDKDKLIYKSWYADQLLEWQDAKKAYKNEYTVQSDIKIPSQQKAVELFQEVLNKDPQKMFRSLAKAQEDIAFFGKSEKAITKQFTREGEEWVKTKGYELFNQSLTSAKFAEGQKMYFDALLSKGYNGLRDVNDINNDYKADDPVIIINPSKNLKNTSSVELGLSEIRAAGIDHANRYTTGIERRNYLNIWKNCG